MNHNSTNGSETDIQRVFSDAYWNIDKADEPRGINNKLGPNIPRFGSGLTGKTLASHLIPRILVSKMSGIGVESGLSLDPNSPSDIPQQTLGRYSLILYEAELLGIKNMCPVWDVDKLLRTDDGNSIEKVKENMSLTPAELMIVSSTRGMKLAQLALKTKKPLIISYLNYHGAPGEVTFTYQPIHEGGERGDNDDQLRYIRAAGFLIALPSMKGGLTLRGIVPRRTKNIDNNDNLIEFENLHNNSLFKHSSVVGETNLSYPKSWDGTVKLSRIRSAVVF